MSTFNLEKSIKRLEDKVAKIALNTHTQIKEERPNQTWVKVGMIQELTGWSGEQLRRARNNGIIKMRREDKKISYLLESLNPAFILSKFNGGLIKPEIKLLEEVDNKCILPTSDMDKGII